MSTPTIVAALDETGLLTTFPETSVFTPISSGIYQVSAILQVTDPANTSSTLGAASVYYTSADTNTTVSSSLTSSSTGNASSTVEEGVAIINALAGQPISVGVSYVSSPAYLSAECTATTTANSWEGAAVALNGTSIAAVGGAGNGSNVAVTTVSVTYSPTAGNSVVVMFNAGYPNLPSSLVVKDSNGNTLTAGPTYGGSPYEVWCFYQSSVPVGITGYTATWSGTSYPSMVVEEYSGVTSVGTLSPNTAHSTTSSTATLLSTLAGANDWIVVGFGSAYTWTGTVGNLRQQNVGNSGYTSVCLMDNTLSGNMQYSAHFSIMQLF